MEQKLKLYKYDNGELVSFPSKESQIEIGVFTYTAKRMGDAPTITATINHKECLDNLWTGKECVIFNDEFFYVKNIPTSSYSNTDSRYKHECTFVNERSKLNGVLFTDVVDDKASDGKPVSNSSKFSFNGNITEFVARLNASLRYAKLQTIENSLVYGYHVVIDEGTKAIENFNDTFNVSFEDKTISEAIQEIYNSYNIPYYFEGKTVHVGLIDEEHDLLSDIDGGFKYGVNNELISISKSNKNNKIINRITALGSSENIPYYYPNETEKGSVAVTEYGKDTTPSYVELFNPFLFAKKIGEDDKIQYLKGNASWSSGVSIYEGDDSLDFSSVSFDESVKVKCKREDGSVHHESNIKICFSIYVKDRKDYFTIKPYIAIDNSAFGGGYEYSFNKDLVLESYLSNEHGRIDLVAGDEKFNPVEIPVGAYQLWITYKVSHRYAKRTSISSFIDKNVKVKLEVFNSNEKFWFLNDSTTRYNLEDFGLRLTDGVSPYNGMAFAQKVTIPYYHISQNLILPIYRSTQGEERFYNAYNATYQDENGNYYDFKNEYAEDSISEHIVKFDDIKPTIKGVEYNGRRIDKFAEFAYDISDNDIKQVVEDKEEYQHPYFFAKLPPLGFNLFDHALETGEMTISMTSGHCAGCSFTIMVNDANKNTVQVDEDGNLKYDEGGYVLVGSVNGQGVQAPIVSQNDTTNNSVWIALKKDIDSFGTILPSSNIKPSSNDTFVITNILLPQEYIEAAEERLKNEAIKYMAENNSSKFSFSIKFSRIFLAENPTIFDKISENSRIAVNYNGSIYQFHVSSYSYKMSEGALLPEIDVSLTDSVVISTNAIESAVSEAKADVLTYVDRYATLEEATTIFIRKDKEDYSPSPMVYGRSLTVNESHKVGENLDVAKNATIGEKTTTKAIQVGEQASVGNYVEGVSGIVMKIDSDGSSYMELDRLKVRMKAYFDELEVQKVNTVGGKMIMSPAGSFTCGAVLTSEELIANGEDVDTTNGSFYRCFFNAVQDDEQIENKFIVGDFAFSQSFNLTGRSSNKMYWREVVGVSSTYVDLSYDKCALDSDIPSSGDIICQLGSKVKDRQNAIVMTTVDEYSPAITLHYGIKTYSLVGTEIVQYGVRNGKAFFNSYGDMFLGEKPVEGVSNAYMKYTTEGGLEIKGKLSVGTTLGDKDLEQYIKESTPEGYDTFVSEVKTTLEGLQKQIDGAIDSYFFDYDPTNDNYPTNSWVSEEEKESHLGDTFTNNSTGESWRFGLVENEYKWIYIEDTATKKALAQASSAYDLADGKRTIFVEQPKPPYQVGDLWAAGKDKPLKRCINSRESKDESFHESDWDLADNSQAYAEAQAAQFNYLKAALKESTGIDGGLIQTSLIKLGYTNADGKHQVMSGTNGIADSSLIGGGIATWWGGEMHDLLDYYTWDNEWIAKEGVTIPSNIPSGLIRFDGTGYFAKGNIWWDETGNLHADPLSFFVGEDSVGALLASFQVVNDKDGKIDYLIPKAPFSTLTVGELRIKDENGRFVTLKFKDGVLLSDESFASEKSIATKGIGASSGGGGVVPWSEIENSIIPKVTDTYSIGTNTNKWKSIYAIEGHINSLVAHTLSAESIKLNGKDVATKEYVIAMVAQGGGGGTGGSSTVSYLPTIESGKEIGTLIVDGVSYGLFAPSRYSWDEIDDTPNFATVAFSGSYKDLADVPTIPTIVGLASEEWVNTQLDDYQKKITSSNKLSYALISGTPTSLPASDVSSWAKADSKPSYSWSEINSRPTKLSEFTDDVVKGVYQPLITTEKKLSYTLISGVPTSLKNPYSLKFGSKTYDGSSQKEITASDLGALTSHQTIYKLTIQKNGVQVGTFTPNSKDATINIDGVVTLSDEQEIAGRKTFKGCVRLDSNTVIRNAQLIGTNASDVVLWKIDNTGNATFVNGVLGGTLSVTKESIFTGKTTHNGGIAATSGAFSGLLSANGGIVIPSGKTLKIGGTVIEEKDGDLFVNGNLAASGSIATKGIGSSSSGNGGGNSYGRLDDWTKYDASKGDVLSALLGYGLKNDIATLTSKFGNYFTKNETRNEIVAYLNDFNDEMIVPNYSTKNEVSSLADVVGGIGSRVSTLEGKATTVSFAQTLQSGKQIGVISIDGKNTTLFAPSGYAWGEITSKPTTLAGYGITDGVPMPSKNLYYYDLNTLLTGDNPAAVVPYFQRVGVNEDVNNIGSARKGVIRLRGGSSESQLVFDHYIGTIYYRNYGESKFSDWRTILDSSNYTDYTYSKTQVDTKLGSYQPLATAINTGNIGSQSVESANRLRCIMNIPTSGFDANTSLVGGGYIPNYSLTSRWGSTMPRGMSYGVVYQLQGYMTGESLAGQLAWDVNHKGADSTNKLWWRANDDTGFVNAKWHQIAFTDSNVASADKLSDNTAYTAWGQTFFENGKPKSVSGNLNIGTSRLMFADSSNTDYQTMYLSDTYGLYIGDGTSSKYNTSIWGDNLQFITGTNGQVRLCIKNNGNVLIGTTTDSGYKLGVNGNIKSNAIQTATVCIECSETGETESYGGEINRFEGNLYLQNRQGTLYLSYTDGSTVIRSAATIGSAYNLAGSNCKLYVNGNSHVNGTLNVSGASTFDSNLHTKGNLYINPESTSGYSNSGYLSFGHYGCRLQSDFSNSYRTTIFGNSNNGSRFNVVRTDVAIDNLCRQYGNGLAWGSHDTNGYLAVSFEGGSNGRYAFIGGGNADNLNWSARLFHNKMHINPNTTQAYNLGDSTKRWLGIYGVSGNFSSNVTVGGKLKIGGILIEDKDGDLFINGNLAASGSVATKGIYGENGKNAFVISDNSISLGYGYRTGNCDIYGGNTVFRAGESSAISMRINSDCNITLGESDWAGSTYKLYVNGNSIYRDVILADRYNGQGNTSGASLIISKGGKYFGIGPSNENVTILSMGLCSDTKGTWDKEVISIIENGDVTLGSTLNVSEYLSFGTYGARLQSDFTQSYRTTIFGNSNNGSRLKIVRTDVTIDNLSQEYGNGLAWGSHDTNGYLAVAYHTGYAFIGGGSSDKLNWSARLFHNKMHINPNTTQAYNLGDSTKRWLGIYGVSGNFSSDVTVGGKLKIGGILIEDKDGDLFINGNLAASGSVATKGIGTSSSGGSGTILWSEVPMSILPANNTLDLGSNAKPWDRVFASVFGTDNQVTQLSGTSIAVNSRLVFANGYDYIDEDGNAHLHSVYMDDELAATQSWVNGKLGAAASYGIGYVQSGNNGLVTGNSVYVALTSYESDVLTAKYATLANTYTKTQVNNNFAAKSEAEIVYSVSVTGDRNVAPSLNLDCGNGVWSLRNAYNGTNGDLKFLFDEQQRAQLTPAGDLTISGRLTQSSDETLKNILSYNVDMKVRDIANAPICYFTWKDRVSDRQIGTIAQYWRLITPECVVGEEGRMSMDYSTLGLVSSIVNAREIVKHEDEIETLKKRVKELEDKLAALKAA